jgi:hypothetical protein
MNEITKDVTRQILRMRIEDLTKLLANEEAEIKTLKNLIHNKELTKRNLQQAIVDTKTHINKI